MGTFERSKKKVHIWKKAAFHFLLCFVMGFFTGFAPTGSSSSSSSSSSSVFSNHLARNHSIRGDFSPLSIEESLDRSLLMAETPVEIPSSTSTSDLDQPISQVGEEEEDEAASLTPLKQLIVITGIRSNDPLQGAFVIRLSNTLKLVPPPLLWIFVEPHKDSSELSEILRKTGVMYRHLVYKENFTDPASETEHQRNLALNHIEHHRLSGVIHFAGVFNIYDLEFFQSLRETEVFGTWPMAMVAANRNKVVMEGPICASSQVVGWHLRNMNSQMNIGSSLHISSFAFNSSILWDPERWGRPSSTQETPQNSIKIVQEVVVEEESKLKGLPGEDCSKILMWELHIPKRHSMLQEQLRSPPNGNWR